MNISEKIKTLRLAFKLSQKELAELANLSEMSIRKYEGEQRYPKYSSLEKIASALQISVSFFFNNDKSFSYELLNELVQINMLDSFKNNLSKEGNMFNFLSELFDVDETTLTDVFYNNTAKELSSDLQIRLVLYYHSINHYLCYDFIKKFEPIIIFPEVRKFTNLLLNTILISSNSSKTASILSAFKDYLGTVYDYNAYSITERDLYEVEKKIHNYLEIELFKIQNNSDDKFN